MHLSTRKLIGSAPAAAVADIIAEAAGRVSGMTVLSMDDGSRERMSHVLEVAAHELQCHAARNENLRVRFRIELDLVPADKTANV